jgi:hypothetical protein
VSGVCAPSALRPCAGKQTLAAQSTTWEWQTKAETAGTTVNADELAIAVCNWARRRRAPAAATWGSRREADPDDERIRAGERARLESHIATFFEVYNYTRGDPGPFPLVECRIGIAGEDLAAVAAPVNGEALALKQAVGALQRQRLFARKAIGAAIRKRRWRRLPRSRRRMKRLPASGSLTLSTSGSGAFNCASRSSTASRPRSSGCSRTGTSRAGVAFD